MNRAAVNDYRPQSSDVFQGTPFGELLAQRTEEDKKQSGIDRAAEHEGQAWTDYAYAALERLAGERHTFFVDDLYAACDWLPRNPNSWGSIWQRAKRAGLIRKTSEMRPSKLPGKHAHEYVVYESLVYLAGRSVA